MAFAAVLSGVFYLLFTAGLILFIRVNHGLFFSTAKFSIISVIALLVFPAVYAGTFWIGNDFRIFSAVVTVLSILLLAFLIYKGLIADLFQPLALTTEGTIVMIAGGVLTLIANIICSFSSSFAVVSFASSLGLFCVMLWGFIWAKAQGWQKFKNFKDDPLFIFENEEGGYSTFRIPSLVRLKKDFLNIRDKNFTSDVLMACAEGRKNSARDTGVVDIVCKFSSDNGKTWTPLKVLFTYGEKVGKYGNPTPVADEKTGLINFVLMTATEESGFNYDTYCYRGFLTSDYELHWEDKKNISLPKLQGKVKSGSDGVRKDTLMVGPGKGVQIKNGEKAGRLVIPASNDGDSFVLYSDDNGKHWQRGEKAGSGNECEAAELPNGDIVMVVRENTPCTMYHPKQFQRLSYSSDGGESWYESMFETKLRTPICMASLDRAGEFLCISYPDSFTTRCGLTAAVSFDGGKSWSKKLLYSGAAGYSSIALNEDGDAFILAEIGKVNYNEALVFLHAKF